MWSDTSMAPLEAQQATGWWCVRKGEWDLLPPLCLANVLNPCDFNTNTHRHTIKVNKTIIYPSFLLFPPFSHARDHRKGLLESERVSVLHKNKSTHHASPITTIKATIFAALEDYRSYITKKQFILSKWMQLSIWICSWLSMKISVI